MQTAMQSYEAMRKARQEAVLTMLDTLDDLPLWHIELCGFIGAPFLVTEGDADYDAIAIEVPGATADDALAYWRATADCSTDPGDYRFMRAIPAEG